MHTCVPKGSLKVIRTDAILSLFHVGLKIRFPNRRVIKFCTISLPLEEKTIIISRGYYYFKL